MFSALICLSFLPWSILNLKEKSGRVILAELYSFRSHVVNTFMLKRVILICETWINKLLTNLHTNTLVWNTHRLANVTMQGDIQARKY